MKKRLLYPTYNQNFDRLFQMIKEQKEEWKKQIGIEEIHIFLFEKDSVWNETYFNKYQKGILLSGSLSPDCKEELETFIQNQPSLTLGHVEIPDYQYADFMDAGRAYLIE